MRLLFLHNFLQGGLVQAFCGMLLHSLWQGLIFTTVTGLAMVATKKSGARLRYNILAVLFFLFVAVCGVTFVLCLQAVTPVQMQVASGGRPGLSAVQALFAACSQWFTANAPAVVLVWFVVFCAKCARFTGSLMYSRRVKHYRVLQPPAQWAEKVQAMCSRLGIQKKVLLLQSGIVKIPVVIGHFKPVIFVPLGLLNSMPAGEMEAVLLHELAHIRRSDYLVNFIQVVAENIFFFNPALLWMSALLREEREDCCDDIALAEAPGKKQFIQALISFKELALHTSQYTTAFPAKNNQLLQRVTRIALNKPKSLDTAEKSFFFASVFMLVIICAAMRIGAPAQAAPPDIKAAPEGAPQVKAEVPANGQGENTFRLVAGKAGTTPVPKSVSGNAGREITVKRYHAAEKNKAVAEDGDVALQEDRPKDQGPEPAEQKTAEARQAELDRQQAERDRQQAELDRRQADEDRKQAERDRVQAEEDRKQAMRDAQQAKLDQAAAEEDRRQADLARQEADKQRAAALQQQHKNAEPKQQKKG